jgi:hypothetical protein
LLTILNVVEKVIFKSHLAICIENRHDARISFRHLNQINKVVTGMQWPTAGHAHCFLARADVFGMVIVEALLNGKSDMVLFF